MSRRSAFAVALALWVATDARSGAAAPAAPASKPPSEEQRIAAAIEKTLQRHGPEVHRCFETALADRLDVAGKLEVEVEVGPGGKVKEAKLVNQGADGSAVLAACVLASAQRWTVEGVEAGAAVVLPFSFQGQMSQFVVKAADVPDRGPAAPKARGGIKAVAPFAVKVLADPVNMRSQQASLTLLTVGPASRVAMHRHPGSAKILYLLKGRARVLGPKGTQPETLVEGAAIFLPKGYPHVIENMGRQIPAVFLQAFTPPGPERVYRDATDAKGRAEFEVIRDPGKALLPTGGKAVVANAATIEAVPAAGGKAKVRVLFDAKVTGSDAMALSLIEFQPGAVVARHSHPGSSELLYVVSGGGTITIGSEDLPLPAEAIAHVPADQPHAAKWNPTEPTIAVQFFAPASEPSKQ